MFNSLKKAVSVIFGANAMANTDYENQDRPLEIMEQFVEGQIRLLELNEVLLEKIFSFLHVGDLAVFSRTCKTSKQVSTKLELLSFVTTFFVTK